jgi:hypothetical protein
MGWQVEAFKEDLEKYKKNIETEKENEKEQ